MTTTEIIISLVLALVVGLFLKMFDNEITRVTSILRENLFKFLVLSGIIAIMLFK
ncbi:hypothetical protein AB1J28_20215 [Lysinibacillus irui]|uniref:hypothetical protein n=1 Tax=Lysinibacillus TaxID=400634 RepID=UPI00196748C2|nr:MULTISPECIES: hypothetical protein [Lysinibacillus]MED4553905.1 hypothetical protein [Lysinibacillus capsici]QSB12064.1 hypothetical protein JTI58_10855 [Lysinibacillus fusiformis]